MLFPTLPVAEEADLPWATRTRNHSLAHHVPIDYRTGTLSRAVAPWSAAASGSDVYDLAPARSSQGRDGPRFSDAIAGHSGGDVPPIRGLGDGTVRSGDDDVLLCDPDR